MCFLGRAWGAADGQYPQHVPLHTRLQLHTGPLNIPLRFLTAFTCAGLGKTLQTIALIVGHPAAERYRSQNVFQTLILCPLSCLQQVVQRGVAGSGRRRG